MSSDKDATASGNSHIAQNVNTSVSRDPSTVRPMCHAAPTRQVRDGLNSTTMRPLCESVEFVVQQPVRQNVEKAASPKSDDTTKR